MRDTKVALASLVVALGVFGVVVWNAPDYQGTVDWVVDADTLHVSGVPKPVRLARVDAPEADSKIGTALTAQVIDLFHGHEAILWCESELGKYGRLVCEVQIDGVNLSDWLLDTGNVREWSK